MVIIITKIELEGTDNLKHTDVGYTTDNSIMNQINNDYDVSLGAFLATNRNKIELGEVSVSTFFSSTSFTYEARFEIEDITDLGLIEITDINQL